MARSLTNRKKSRRPSAKAVNRRLLLESLENRRLMAGDISTQWIGSTLAINGNDLNNTIVVRENALGRVTIDGVAGDIARPTRLLVNGRGGNDVIYNDTKVSMEAYGGEGKDTITGGLAGDWLFGDGGDDFIRGRRGNDEVRGGIGNDQLFSDLNDSSDNQFIAEYRAGHRGSDVLVGDDGDDILDGSTAIDSFGWNDGELMIRGTQGGNTIVLRWNDGFLYVDGVRRVWQGPDTVEVVGGEGNDVIYNDTHVPMIAYGDGGRDELTGGSGNDILYAGSGQNDLLRGFRGDDLLFSGSGNNTLIGGDGIDTVRYSHAVQGINVDLRASRAIGDGTDQVLEMENVIGSDYADVIFGNDLANVLEGGAGNDSLNGGWGNDTLWGGTGRDTLIGGPNPDRSLRPIVEISFPSDSDTIYFRSADGEQAGYHPDDRWINEIPTPKPTPLPPAIEQILILPGAFTSGLNREFYALNKSGTHAIRFTVKVTHPTLYRFTPAPILAPITVAPGGNATIPAGTSLGWHVDHTFTVISAEYVMP